MVFWQLTINAADPSRLARFWAEALGYQPFPPTEPDTTWNAHYRGRLGGRDAFPDRIFDPTGSGPPLWFQQSDSPREGSNRLHLDLYPTGRDDALAMDRRVEIVDARVAELLALGASVQVATRGDTYYWVTLQDPEGNEFCVS